MPLRHYLWLVVAATLVVAVCPIAGVWWLRSSGVITSAPLVLAAAVALSLGASRLGTTIWQKHNGSRDLLFGELMVWGFVHRWYSERRLVFARELLGTMSDAEGVRECEAGPDVQAKALERLGGALEATDPYTHGHSRRVARHSWMIAKRLGLRGDMVARIRTAAALHDIGKIETPPSVLRKPGRLTDAEFEVIKRHPVDGERIVAVMGDEELAAIVLHHHERLDGTGYPNGLSGEEIPIGARIIAVADTFDAITSVRPYRSTRSHKQALDILRNEAGTQLDPAVVRAFCALYSGRRPLALWASLTSLPAQVFSWLGGGVVGAASVAQVAAVTAAAAVGAAATATPVRSGHQGAKSTHALIASRDAAPTGEQFKARLATARGGSTPRTSRRRAAGDSRTHHSSAAPSLRAGTALSAPQAGAVTGTTGHQTSAPSTTIASTPTTREEVANRTGPAQPAKPEPPAKPAPPAKPEPPAKPAPPAKPEPPAKPAPPAKPEPPAKPAPPAKPEPPAKPAPPAKPEPPAKPAPPAKPEPPAKP